MKMKLVVPVLQMLPLNVQILLQKKRNENLWWRRTDGAMIQRQIPPGWCRLLSQVTLGNKECLKTKVVSLFGSCTSTTCCFSAPFDNIFNFINQTYIMNCNLYFVRFTISLCIHIQNGAKLADRKARTGYRNRTSKRQTTRTLECLKSSKKKGIYSIVPGAGLGNELSLPSTRETNLRTWAANWPRGRRAASSNWPPVVAGLSVEQRPLATSVSAASSTEA